jgi:hypothetical protein
MEKMKTQDLWKQRKATFRNKSMRWMMQRLKYRKSGLLIRLHLLNNKADSSHILTALMN